MSRTIDRNQAIALSLHPWHNTAQDWETLAALVFKMGASAPKQARAALASFKARAASLPNPFAS
jgi:hypothetical protein